MKAAHPTPRFWRRWIFSVLAAAALGLLLHLPLRANGYSPGKAAFSVKVRHEIIPYKVFGVYVLPGEKLAIESEGFRQESLFYFNHSAGRVLQEGPNRWLWQAPETTGLHTIQIGPAFSAEAVTLNVFVMVPYASLKGEYLEGYRIGAYPKTPLQKLSHPHQPKGFIRVTEENQETFLSPHFRLKQFLCKQQGCYPKFVVLQEKLLLKLELILEMVNRNGFAASTFHVMSGYRTPFYNRSIGNGKNSRHIYGEAADIFIDEAPRDDFMDDLNADGKMDIRDAEILYQIIDEMYGRPWYEAFIGGLGRYRRTNAHGPFVHVDVRGFRARWGD